MVHLDIAPGLKMGGESLSPLSILKSAFFVTQIEQDQQDDETSAAFSEAAVSSAEGSSGLEKAKGCGRVEEGKFLDFHLVRERSVF